MAFNNWVKILANALKFAYEIKTGESMNQPICYRPEFDTATRKQFEKIIKKLFEHPLWVKPVFQNDIAKANKENAVSQIFDAEKLNYMHLIKI
jgi:hypothetical protein